MSLSSAWERWAHATDERVRKGLAYLGAVRPRSRTLSRLVLLVGAALLVGASAACCAAVWAWFTSFPDSGRPTLVGTWVANPDERDQD
jgi:hypothetical protein